MLEDYETSENKCGSSRVHCSSLPRPRGGGVPTFKKDNRKRRNKTLQRRWQFYGVRPLYLWLLGRVIFMGVM